MYNESHEFGKHAGLGLIAGKVLPLSDYTNTLSIPNIGWNPTCRHGKSSLIQQLSDQELCFYYVHSFFCKADDRNIVTASISYGAECDSIIESKNLFGCQFHPEKSQSSGITILKNFAEL